MPYVDLAPRPAARPDLVLRCNACRQDVGVHGDVDGLNPHTYVCCQCLVERAGDPDPEPILRAVA